MRSQIRKITCVGALVALAAIVAAGGARGSTITVFSNFGSNNSFSPNSPTFVDGPAEGDIPRAMPFSANSTANLADAVLALQSIKTNNAALTLDLETSSNGLPSGTILDSLTQQGTIPASSPGLVTFDYNGAPMKLTVGVQYWLVALQTGALASDSWFSSNSDTGVVASNFSNSATGPWNSVSPVPIGAFRVDGTPVTTTPEPASLLLLGTGLLGLAALLRRRHLCVRG